VTASTGSAAMFGAVGDRSAADLAKAFTRDFPQAASGDPVWRSTPLGAAGEATLVLTLDDGGHIADVQVVGTPSAPLLFAHSRSFPVMYSTPPPARFNDLVLENFAATMITSANFCESTRVVTDDCAAEYRARWAEFWRDAIPRYDHVLLWEPSQEALELVPPDYGITFRQDGLVIMERGGGRNAPVSTRSIEQR
jgi:hypothetical protein